MRLTTLVSAGVIITGLCTPVNALQLNEFLDQVRGNNLDVQRALQTIQASKKKLATKDLFNTPQLGVSYGFNADDKVTNFSSFTGSQSQIHALDAHMQVLLDNGLTLTSGYRLDSVNYPQSKIQPASYSDATPYLELSYPLMKNAGGKQVQASKSIIDENTIAGILMNEFAIESLIVNAETAYWRLALSREAVQLAEDAVTRAKKMVDWAQSRQSLQLGDTSDLLQVEGLLKLRQLELRQANDDEAAATRLLNQLRNQKPNQAIDSIQPIGDVELSKIKSDSNGTRKDVSATQHLVRALKANAIIENDTYEPALTVLGRLALNQTSSGVIDAVVRTAATDHIGTFVGIQWSGALDIGTSTIATIKSGISGNIQAAETDLQAKKVAARDQWADLNQRLNDAQKRIELVQGLESVQKNRWQSETDRHRKGRSTMIQVLNAEQDYANARLMHLRVRTEILTLSAQLKLFGSGK